MDESLDTRHSLILRLRDSADVIAWREFAALYEPLIVRLARAKGLQDADARDLCQEVLLAVAKAADRWDPDPARGSFRGWLSRVTRNLLINFLTRREEPATGRTSIVELLEAQPKADPSVTGMFDLEYRRRLFHWAAEKVEKEFAPETWQAFWRTAVRGEKPANAAQELGISIGAVYIARSRVMARLRKQIEELGEETATIILEDDHGRPIEPL
jgi:RNA polymerase sigma-70 factor (ECF subfamily)